ncbi:MAG: PLP-dependent aminotransferase family protein [Candidatus Promineifilaceae bacterium]
MNGLNELLLDHDGVEPLYRQLYDQLRQRILTGKLAPGARMPGTRKLAAALGIGRITVIQAYVLLAEEGFLQSRPGAASTVTDAAGQIEAAAPAFFEPQLSPWGKRISSESVQPRPSRPRLEIDFGFGRSFPHIFPYGVWRRLLARYLSTDDVMLSRYGSPAGFLPLREALAGYLQRHRGVNCTADQVIIVSGAQQALDLLARLLLAPGDEIVVETPGYRDAYQLFLSHGAHLLPRAVDEHGLPVNHLPSGHRVRLAFVTPSHQFPRGGTLPLERRLALLQWAQNVNALIIEDDYDSELRYDSRPPSALQGLDSSGHVIYLGTFSKVLFPALRLGYVVLPPPLVGPFAGALALVDRGAPTLTQAAVADFIAGGHFERHLRHLRAAYGERRAALVDALDATLAKEVSYSQMPAGLHVMLMLHEACSEIQVIRDAAAAGVGIYPGAPYYVEHPAPPSILLGFSGLDTAQIKEGIQRLAAVIPRCGTE